ncbi:MAG: hypothetical protein WC714_20200 [Candidatus Obscuribacterales bacterium]|jgi:uncharacterized membrane protein YcjF (UPF0283 family)
MIIQFLAIAALLGSAICLFAHLRSDACIRRLLPLAVDTVAARRNAVESYRKLDRQRIKAGWGVVFCWAICAGLWSTTQLSDQWSSAEQIAFKAVACTIFIVCFFAAQRHNFQRDAC